MLIFKYLPMLVLLPACCCDKESLLTWRENPERLLQYFYLNKKIFNGFKNHVKIRYGRENKN